MNRKATLYAAAAAMLLLGMRAIAQGAPDDAESVARWQSLKAAFFEGRAVDDTDALIAIDAPARAVDAANVPIGLTVKGDRPVRGIYLIIDANPVPLAAHFVFGPRGFAHTVTLPVRVNAYTLVHAVAETEDGKLYATARFIKASGGCSAPPDNDMQAALSGIGKLNIALEDSFVAGKPQHVQLSIRHPNFNGMQMNQITRNYTPARYIRTIDITYGDAQVLHLDSDISLSSDPVIGFAFVPPKSGELKVQIKDTDGAVYGNSFAVPSPAG